MRNSKVKLLTVIVAALLGTTITAGLANAKPQDRRYADEKYINRDIDDKYKVFYGDLHNHSDLTYGHGSFENALENAVQQLDFFTMTPHAMWPDIENLRGNDELEWVIDYHTGAFKKLRNPAYWQNYIDKLKAYETKNKVITFPSYEVHSLKYGDHVVVHKQQDVQLPAPKTTIVELRDKVLDPDETIITPHGVAYQSGFRGYNWDYFKQSDQTPFVEVFSRHGGSEGSVGPFGLYHDMGPRSFEGSAEAGLRAGHKFGLMASTDSHAGHPGSYGGGRIAVLANELSRDAIWDAIKARRVYALTGANIKLDFKVNEGYMGEEINDSKNGKRKIHVAVEAADQIDYVELIKNGKTLKRVHADYTPEIPQVDKDGMLRAKIKFEFGWNQVSSKERISWDGNLALSGGEILEATSQFRGAPFTSPQKDMAGHEVPWESAVNKVTNISDQKVSFVAYSESNPMPTVANTQAIMLDVHMKPTDKIVANINGQRFEHTLEELLEGDRSHFMRGWLTEAISFNRAVPVTGFKAGFDIEDSAENKTDYYYLRVRQTDHQWAWSSPIWVNKK